MGELGEVQSYTWEGPEDMPLTNPIRLQIVREAPAKLRNFIVIPFLVPDLRAGDIAAQLDELKILGDLGPQSSRIQVVAVNSQRQGNHSYFHGQQRQSNVHIA